MFESMPIVAFDQHAASVMAAVLLPGQREPAIQQLSSDLPTIWRFVERLQQHGDVRCCYEAGPCGFGLQRFLSQHGVHCDIIAPALIPRRPGSRIKTDRRDAAQLARLYRAGTLTAIHVPTDQEEAVRDLLRCREDVRADLLRARHRLAKFLLRHGRRFTETRAWSKRHDAWMRAQRWEHEAATQTHQAYLRALDEATARLQAVETDLQDCWKVEPVASRAARLRCFRGIDDLTALTIAAELSDPRRFRSARSLMAYLGVVPSERSSGATHTRGSITKTGNAHIRRVLIEAAWHYRHPPLVGKGLARRQADQPETVRAHAWRAQHRLHRRYRRLTGRGKSRQTVVTALGRELAGFLWAVLTEPADRPSSKGESSHVFCDQ
jgi:transposase